MSAASIDLKQERLDEIARSGVAVPSYDRGRLRPRIVHLGLGGFSRAHLARYTDAVAAQGGDWGITGLGMLPADAAMADALQGQDHLYTLVEKGPGTPQAAVVGSLVGYVHAPQAGDGRATDLLADPGTAILSLTVTEGGYGEATPEQLEAGTPTTFDRIAAALAVRRERGAGGLTILSCDNLPGNGTAARRATLAAAERAGGGLDAWVQEHCSFPNAMVDRITPQTADADREWLLEAHGLRDAWPVVAEPFRQWVLEDDFVAGRPRWEDDGALFTDRVHDWELYKLRMLNAAHSSMAYLCSLASITYVDEAMDREVVRTFLERLLHQEAIPTLTEIPGHPREAYAADVLERFANTGVRDQISRLCLDGSSKFPVFLVPTVLGQLEQGGSVTHAATALAGWARYLAATPEDAQAFDPAGAAARRHAAAAESDPRAFLAFDAVFPEPLRSSERFAGAFAEAYARIVADGPLAAMAATHGETTSRAPQ